MFGQNYIYIYIYIYINLVNTEYRKGLCEHILWTKIVAVHISFCSINMQTVTQQGSPISALPQRRKKTGYLKLDLHDDDDDDLCILQCTRIYITWWYSWLMHCATSRKVAGSISDGVTGIFRRHKPSGLTVALGSTHPPTELSTRNISWGGKGGRCLELITWPPSCADCLETWEPQTPGTLRVCSGLSWDCFTFTFSRIIRSYLATYIKRQKASFLNPYRTNVENRVSS